MLEKIHRTYEKALKHHPWGSALYIPVDAKHMYPGSVGVFNDDGHWIKAKWDVFSQNHGFAPLVGQAEDLQIITTNLQWDVVHSEKISKMSVKVKSRMSLFTKLVPSSVEATFQLDSTSEAAAVLQCGPIIRSGIGNINLSIKDWGRKNKAKIFNEARDAKSLGGFFVVTATYKTKWCRARCWSTTSLQSFAKLQVAADDETGVGEVSIQMSTKTADKSGLTLPAEKDAVGAEFVVFVEGVFFPVMGSASRKVIYAS